MGDFQDATTSLLMQCLDGHFVSRCWDMSHAAGCVAFGTLQLVLLKVSLQCAARLGTASLRHVWHGACCSYRLHHDRPRSPLNAATAAHGGQCCCADRTAVAPASFMAV